MHILIVEDEFNLADAVRDRLKKEKYDVDICTDGEEGLYHALLDIYDLIILDVMLPNINGKISARSENGYTTFRVEFKMC